MFVLFSHSIFVSAYLKTCLFNSTSVILTDTASFITGRGFNNITKPVIWPSKRMLKFVVL